MMCNSYVLNITCINIANPHILSSTIQENIHVENAHIPSYDFIEKNKHIFLTIFDNYSNDNTRNREPITEASYTN